MATPAPGRGAVDDVVVHERRHVQHLHRRADADHPRRIGRAEARGQKDERGTQHLAAGVQHLPNRGVDLRVLRGRVGEDRFPHAVKLPRQFRLPVPKGPHVLFCRLVRVETGSPGKPCAVPPPLEKGHDPGVEPERPVRRRPS